MRFSSTIAMVSEGAVQVALGSDRAGALTWLEDNCGLSPRRASGRVRSANRDRQNSEYFGMAALALAETTLETINPDNPERANLRIFAITN